MRCSFTPNAINKVFFIMLLATGSSQASVIYTFDIATNSPINPIQFSVSATDYLTQTGSLAITPFTVSDTLGDSWSFTNGLINVAPMTSLACFGIVAPPAVSEASTCGVTTNPPGGGFLFIFSDTGGPIYLPPSDGVFTVQTDYVLNSASGVSFDGVVATTLTVSSVPEPRMPIAIFAGFIALLGFRLSRTHRPSRCPGGAARLELLQTKSFASTGSEF
jgi:hypothetical protein